MTERKKLRSKRKKDKREKEKKKKQIVFGHRLNHRSHQRKREHDRFEHTIINHF